MHCVVFVVAESVEAKLQRLHLDLILVAGRRRIKEWLEQISQSVILIRIIPSDT